MTGREPIATPRARGKLGQLWVHIGLVVAMLLCVTATPKGTAALVSSVLSTGADVLAQTDEGQTFASASGAAQYRRGEHAPATARELRAPEAETEETDATSESEAVATPLGFVWGQPDACVGVVEDVITGDTARLLVSTGLGRGPPLG